MPHKWLLGNFYLQRGSGWHLSLFTWRMMEEVGLMETHSLTYWGRGWGWMGMVAEPSWGSREL